MDRWQFCTETTILHWFVGGYVTEWFDFWTGTIYFESLQCFRQVWNGQLHFCWQGKDITQGDKQWDVQNDSELNADKKLYIFDRFIEISFWALQACGQTVNTPVWWWAKSSPQLKLNTLNSMRLWGNYGCEKMLGPVKKSYAFQAIFVMQLTIFPGIFRSITRF